MTPSATKPFFGWVYDRSSEPPAAPIRGTLERHVLEAAQSIEGIIGPARFDGFVFSDNMTVARGFIERHAAGAADLTSGDQGLHVADRETWASHDPDPHPIAKHNTAMHYVSRRDRSQSFIAMNDIFPCWIHPKGRARDPIRSQEMIGTLAHEMAHARDVSLGLPGMPDPDAKTSDFPHIPYLIAATAREEYIAVRAECAVQQALFGGVPKGANMDQQLFDLRTASAKLSGYADAPPKAPEEWDRTSKDFGYALGQLAAYGNAASPFLSRESRPMSRTTADDLAQRCLPGSLVGNLVKGAQKALAPFDGLAAGASTEAGLDLIFTSAELFREAARHGANLGPRRKVKSSLER